MKACTLLFAAIGLAIIVLLTTACSTPAPAPTVEAIAVAPATAALVPPTDTPIPPTDTPVPPTETPVPPTATSTNTPTPTATMTSTPAPIDTPTRTPTRRPPTATPAPLTLQSALKRTLSHSYRTEMTEYISDPYQEVEMLTARGEVTRQGSHLIIGGMLGRVLGGPNGLETMSAGGKTYIHGPAPAMKANEARWYLLPPSKNGASSTGSVKTDQLLSPDVTRYDKVGNETVDGLACDIYSVDKEAARKALAASGAMTQKELDNMVNIELTYWWCADGYVHRARVRMDFKYPLNPSTTMIGRVESHYFDFNAPIQVNIPTDAIPLPE